MGITNPLHLLFIAAIALIVLGPKRLPELARSLGHGMREFRESISAGGEDDHELLAAAGPAAPAAAQTPLDAQTPPDASSPAASQAAPVSEHDSAAATAVHQPPPTGESVAAALTAEPDPASAPHPPASAPHPPPA